jgi:cysteine-rich repeat protein
MSLLARLCSVESYRWRPAVAATIAAMAAILVTSDAALALTPTEIGCRERAIQIARRAATTTLSIRSKCMRLKLYGRIPLAVNCDLDSGTGHSATDKRLERLDRQRAAAGAQLTSFCDSEAPDLDVDPVDIFPSGTCGAAGDWATAGECIVDVGVAAADVVFASMNVQPAFGVPLPKMGDVECFFQSAQQAQRTLASLISWRSRCFQENAVIAGDGADVYNCGANIAPPGAFNSTGYLRADKRLEVPMERLIETILRECDRDLPTVGFTTAVLTERTGGDFTGRITADDVVDNINDAVVTATNAVMAELMEPASYCGDGSTDAGEECDDGNNTSNDGCDRDCSLPACGNGAVNLADNPLEECDDGNTANGDGCSALCDLERCGNGRLNLGWDEICDDGGESVSCDDDCTPALCGDEEINMTAGEECDEGVLNDSSVPDTCGDGVTPPAIRGACELPFCLDGVTDTGEECDDAMESLACDTNCTNAFCGDGDLNATRGETCDDGNASDADSCPSSNVDGNLTASGHCLVATCGDGFVCTDGATCTTGPAGLPEECDDAGESATCDTDCSVAYCGDSQVNPLQVADHPGGEICDDGNLLDNDGCDSNCTVTGCGNGVVTSGEGCDDDNLVDGDGCDSNCEPTGCGNGVITAGEDCDDTGESATCDGNCTFAGCGDSYINDTLSEECDPGGGLGTPVESGTCDADCSFAYCGDGTTNAARSEDCDDSGESATCDDNCTTAGCGDGTVNGTAGEQCDPGGGLGTPVANAVCDVDCTHALCGDGTVNAARGEDCDDSGESVTCNADCTSAVCGDGVVNATAGEECDDNNVLNGDGCNSACQVE